MRRVLAIIGGLFGVAAVAIGILASDLDRPWIKARLEALAQSSAGVEVEYRSLRLQWLSGLVVDDLVVRSPPEFRSVAPEFVRVGHVEARWSLGALLGRSSGPRVERVSLSEVTLTVVVDEHGRTSFDALFPPSPVTTPPVPLSHQASEALKAPPAVGQIAIAKAAVVVIQTNAGRAMERDTVQGIGVAMSVQPEGTGWSVHAQAGSPSLPLELDLTREREGVAAGSGRGALSFAADVTSSTLTAGIDLQIAEQSFVPSFHGGEWLHADAIATFDPKAGRTRISIVHARAAGDAATAEASLELPDTGDLVVDHASGDVDIARLLAWAPPGLVPFTAERARIRYDVSAVVAGAVPRFSDGGAVTVDVDLSKATLRLSSGVFDVGGAKCTLRGAPTAGSSVASTQGDLALDGTMESVDLRSEGGRIAAKDLVFRAHTHFEGHAPYAGDVDVSSSGLHVFGPGAHLLADGPTRLQIDVRDAYPSAEAPIASRAVVKASLDLGETHVEIDATKAADAVDYAVQARAASLGVVRPFLQPGLAGAAPWDRMAVALRADGHVDRIAEADRAIRENTELTVERPGYGDVSARSLSLSLHSKGTALRHQGDLDLRVQALAIEGGAPSDDHVQLAAALDRERPSLDVELATTGRAETKLSASVSFDRARRAVVYDVRGRLAGLAALAPLASSVHALDGFDLSGLALDLGLRGVVLGVVSAVGGDGTVTFQPAPTRTAGVEGTADVHVERLRWRHGDTAIETQAATWHGEMKVHGDQRTIDSRVDIDALHLGLGRNVIDLAGLSDRSSATVTGDLANPDGSLTLHTRIRSVSQDYAPDYPIGDVDSTLSVERDPEGLIHIIQAKIRNEAGSTSLGLAGGIDLGAGRRRLSLTADVDQDLATLSRVPAFFSGTGAVHVEAKVESPDLLVFRTRSDVKLTGVHVRMPRQGIEADSVDAQIPVTAALELGEHGVTLTRETEPNPYSMLRFADQHPLLSRTGFLSIARLQTPFVTIAPLVGNLEIEQNVVSLRQFEMGLRGGRVTGQCAVDWNGAKSTIELHVRANGVQSSHGEPFDGNIAVVLSAADRSVEGRAEVLRIGKRHLLDLLDLEDPLRVDSAMNRVRSALAFGYPDRLRLTFDHGFASVRLELGGLASLVSLGEMRGIPMGPIIDKFLAPVLDAADAAEANERH